MTQTVKVLELDGAKALGLAIEAAVRAFANKLLVEVARARAAQAVTAGVQKAKVRVEHAPPPAEPLRQAPTLYRYGTAQNGRRLPSETARDAAQVARFLTIAARRKLSFRGLTVREIGVGMDKSTIWLEGPIRYAVEHKLLRKEGERRSTRYFPVKAYVTKASAHGAR